jgi:DNA (cytosine-5)-methyltransferase 1
MAANFTENTAKARFPNLETVVARAMWPTPQASDCRDRGNLSSGAVQRRKDKGKQLGLSQVVSETTGALNPMWVEWLMGFPIGHTDLRDSETP